jgi:PiT family inorganic phosphate transporter
LPELLWNIPTTLWLAGGLALFMAWGIGANDVANAMGTSVGSGALTVRRAIIVAGVLGFSGAFLVGGHVTETIRKGRAGWPVSTTHSIVGAIIGFAVAGLGFEAVVWSRVGQIVASWVVSPLLGGALAFVIFQIVRRTILDQERPFDQAKRVGPFFVFAVVFILGLVTLFKGLKNLRLDFGLAEALALSAAVALLGALVGRIILRRIRPAPGVEERDFHYASVERVFGVLQVMTAAAVAFAHGSNDVANAIGPFAAVFNAAAGGDLAAKSVVPVWMLALGGVGIVIGLATYGYRVMETVGRRITELTPTRGFSAELAAATTIVIASKAGLPVSTTHTLVGSVLGVGLARGIGALDLRVLGRIVGSWVATLPTGAALAAFFFYFFKGLFAP